MKMMSCNTVDFSLLKRDFPTTQMTNKGKPLIYLDSAATAQKPKSVIAAISNFYSTDYANIHRGIYELSQRATHLYENTREDVQRFIHAADPDEIVFVSGTTEGINLIAQTFRMQKWQAGDEIILSEMEHHSNIVPWYQLKEKFGIEFKIIPVNDLGELEIDDYKKLFSSRTKLVAVTHASNVLGTINPVKKMSTIAHEHGVPILINGAQAVPHLPVDVQAIDCDFYVFSAHKLYGPTGVGVLYGKKEILSQLPPYQGGGSMIESVSFAKVTYAKSPQKFEAGTPHIAGVIGLSAAIRYVENIRMENIFSHEQTLLDYTETKLLNVKGLRLIGRAKPKVGVISFILEGIHPHDLGTVLDHEGIAVRASHHCAMPLMERFNVPATVRLSFGIYNNEKDVDALMNGILLAQRILS